MTEIIEIGKISSRGQVAIPSEIRNQIGLQEGSKVLFVLENDTIIMKKVTSESFEQLTRPLRRARKKIKEEDVTELIHKLRQNKK